MTHINKQITIGTMILLISLFIAAPMASQAQNAPSEHAMVIILLDDSGSMADNDPHDVRYTAARLFVSLLDEGDAVGVIRFSTHSQPLTDGVVPITTQDAKHTINQRLQPRQAEGWTNMLDAFRDAREMIEAAERDGYQVQILLLTDGQPEIENTPPGFEQDILDVVEEMDAPVMAIALTQDAETPFLNQVAMQSQGMVIPAHDASDLLDAYLEVLGQIKDRIILQAEVDESSGQAAVVISPDLSPYVEKASFIVSSPHIQSFQLLRPDGEPMAADASSIIYAETQEPQFRLLTLQAPMGGAWRYQVEGAQPVRVRLILWSHLRIEVLTPQRYHEAGAPMPIQVRLIQEQADGSTTTIVGQARFSALITRPDGSQESLDQFYDDGTHGDATAGDGVYTRQYMNTEQPGSYHIAIHGSKGAAPVEQSVQVEVVPFPRMVIQEPAHNHYDIRGERIPLAVTLKDGNPPELDRGDFTAIITDPTGESQTILLKKEGGVYSGSFLPGRDGSYQITFLPRNATYKGIPYDHQQSKTIRVRIIPAIRVASAPIDLGMLDASEAARGIDIPLTVTSTSVRPEKLSLAITGLVGIRMEGPDEFTIRPGQENQIHLKLAADADAPLGPQSGQILLDADEAVDLVGDRIPLKIAIRATLDVSPPEQGLGLMDITRMPDLVNVPITITSTSIRPEPLTIQLEALPQFTLVNELPLTLLPDGETQITLQLKPNTDLTPGEIAGHLRFGGRDGPEIRPQQIDLHGRLYAPVIHLKPESDQLTPEGGCFPTTVTLHLNIASDSAYTETIHMATPDEGLHITPATLTVPPGESQAVIELMREGGFPSGEHTYRIFFSGRDGLTFDPSDRETATVQVTSLWGRCPVPIFGGMAFVAVLLITGVVLTRRWLAAMKPPVVRGTLRYWPSGGAGRFNEIDLTDYDKTEISVGSSTDDDITLNLPGLNPNHFVIHAPESREDAHPILEPRDNVLWRNRKMATREPLTHEDTFTVGSYTFQFLSDEGGQS